MLETTESPGDPDPAQYLKDELYNRVKNDSSLFEFLQSGSLDGIWYWDIENPEIEWLSPRFKELFGYQDHEIPNTSTWWQDNIFPEDLQLAIDNFNKHCKDPCYPYNQIVRYRHKDGSTIWVRCRGIAIRDQHGNPIRMLGAHTDITAIKNAEKELIEKNNELDAFTYSVSHDLRAPVRHISGFLDLLTKHIGDTADEKTTHYLSLVNTANNRMAHLIEDLLLFSRIGKQDIAKKEIGLNRLVNEVIKSFSPEIKDRNIRWKIAELPCIYVDPPLIKQVFENLISNAIKYTRTREEAIIEINVKSTDKNNIVFYVSDNGVGFDMKYVDKLFNVFQRLHRTDEFEGTGIGLANVKRIINRHDGKTWAESILDSGTTIYFSLKNN